MKTKLFQPHGFPQANPAPQEPILSLDASTLEVSPVEAQSLSPTPTSTEQKTAPSRPAQSITGQSSSSHPTSILLQGQDPPLPAAFTPDPAGLPSWKH